MKQTKSLALVTILIATIFYGCKEECGIGYTGSDCNTEIRAQYYGSYNTVTSCSTSYTITISSSNKGVTYVEIGNIDKLGNTVFAEFEPSSQSTLVIPQQVVNGMTFSGSITYTSGFSSANITYNKTLSGGVILPPCSGTATK
jgi:hypothetical protein